MNIKIFKNLTGILMLCYSIGLNGQTYKIVDTGQIIFYDNQNEISPPLSSEAFYGQDAGIIGHQPDYTDNGDGTVSDNVSGLMWQRSSDLNDDGMINIDDKLSHTEALAGTDTFSLGGYSDWRLPTIKESYSLFMLSGEDISGYDGTDTENLTPFINTDYFEIGFGDTDAGERLIDSQFASSTVYVGTTMNGDSTMFGVNFVDGRIKGYPMGPMPGQSEDKQFYVLYVRGNNLYGQNEFVDNEDGTVSDLATGLMWQQGDSETGMNWEAALSHAQTSNVENLLSHSDWRLPNAKELHSILDYSRAPAITASAAIDPIFTCTTIVDEGGDNNYPFYWTSSTHANMQNGAWGVYLCFGEGLGWMPEPFPPFNVSLLDVHGAGSQRSDPKNGSADDYPEGHGPQGDIVRVNNYVRLVRNIGSTTGLDNDQSKGIIPTSPTLLRNYPNPFNPSTMISYELASSALVQLTIYDVTGRRVIELINTHQSSGQHVINWAGQNADGYLMRTGVYFCQLTSGDVHQTIKMVYLQ